jgi:cytochrome b561
MRWKSTPDDWGWIAKFFHWTTAILIVAATAIVVYIVNQDFEHFREQSTLTFRAGIRWHKALGFIAFALLVLRIVWRAAIVRPALPASMAGWEVAGSTATVHLLYLLIAASIVTGWGQVSSNGSVANVFDWFVVPPLVGKDERLHELFEFWHSSTSWGLVGLAAFHTLAALKHHYVDRDGVLRAMLPWR